MSTVTQEMAAVTSMRHVQPLTQDACANVTLASLATVPRVLMLTNVKLIMAAVIKMPTVSMKSDQVAVNVKEDILAMEKHVLVRNSRTIID